MLELQINHTVSRDNITHYNINNIKKIRVLFITSNTNQLMIKILNILINHLMLPELGGGKNPMDPCNYKQACKCKCKCKCNLIIITLIKKVASLTFVQFYSICLIQSSSICQHLQCHTSRHNMRFAKSQGKEQPRPRYTLLQQTIRSLLFKKLAARASSIQNQILENVL